MNLLRILAHCVRPPWSVYRTFNRSALRELEAHIQDSERKHRAEVRFAVEAALDLGPLLRGQTARQRAVQLFSDLGVWDTAENCGVLLYLLLADRQVEIVVDRGLHARVPAGTWEAICQDMEKDFAAGQFREGARRGLDAITALLEREYPAGVDHSNELPDKPVVVL